MSFRKRSRFFWNRKVALKNSDLSKPAKTCPNSMSSVLKRKLESFSNEVDESKESSEQGATSPTKRKRTPLEEQVISLKSQHPGLVLMVECGYRYRFFGNDAEIASKVLDIQAFQDGHGTGHFLTSSVPTNNGPDGYVRKLVSAGHKVGIVSQTETAAEKKISCTSHKGPFERKLTAVYTSSTLLGQDVYLKDDTDALILFLMNDDRSKIHMVGLRPMNGDVVYDTFGPDKGWLLDQRLLLLEPNEVIVPKEPSTFTNQNREIVRRFLDEKDGEIIRRMEETDHFGVVSEEFLSQLHSGHSIDLLQLWPSLSKSLQVCFSAAFLYLKEFGLEKSLMFSNKVDPFSQGAIRKRMHLPAMTVRNMEIFHPLNAPKSCANQATLFWHLDLTTTRFGSRMLRNWVSAPLIDAKAIEQRLDAVEYLASEPSKCKGIRDMLKGVSDVELAVMATLNMKIRITHFVGMINSFMSIPKRLAEICLGEGVIPDMFQNLIQTVTDSCTASVDIAGRLSLKSAWDGNVNDILLDWSLYPNVGKAKEEIKLLEQSLEAHKKTICRSLGLLMFNYSSVSGMDYLIEVKQQDTKSVPGSWLKVSSTKQVGRFRTEFINETLPKLEYAKEKLEIACKRAWTSFLQENVDKFRQMMLGARALAKLDCLVAMAKVSSRDCFSRPIFNQGDAMTITDGRNIIVENAISGQPDRQYVPNHVFFSRQSVRGILLTGPNMGGKSCYIRQIAICCLMAQVGFFVPASMADMPIIDAIYLRTGARDDMWTGKSTLMVELDETSQILKQASEKSLVLIDELGRGTSTHDGAAIARSVFEHLIDKMKCYTVFITHYKKLVSGVISADRPVKNCHMGFHANEEDNEKDVLFLYNLTDGPCPSSFGINVAKIAGLPEPIVDEASKRARDYEEKYEPSNNIYNPST